jgi:hypothetical protein
MTTNMHELAIMGFGPRDESTIRQDIVREPSDTVSGKSVVPTTASMVTSLHYRAGWTRGRRWSARHRPPEGYVGRLVAFVDMKVDELWKNDNTLLEINTGNGKLNAFVVYNRKKVL